MNLPAALPTVGAESVTISVDKDLLTIRDQLSTLLDMLLIMIGFGGAGLLNRKQFGSDPHLPNDPDLARLKESVPLIQARWGWGFGWVKREYEAKLYHQGCWWLVAVGVFSFLIVALQL